uniref:Uncharacterized protein n=1 Tax=Anguilla anguilla TaxID=7936 RepID=A0A0E9PWU9_ANGAN
MTTKIIKIKQNSIVVLFYFVFSR